MRPPGYHAYWNYAEKKGYSGTAIFSKREPLRVQYGMGKEEHDREGRLITWNFLRSTLSPYMCPILSES